MAKRVWIIGAGFSRSLGAPLLDDLLSFRLRARLIPEYIRGRERFTEEDLIEHANLEDLGNMRRQDMVYALYHYGTNFREGYAFVPGEPPPAGESLWGNAEDYLEYLDATQFRPACANAELDIIRRRLAGACVAAGAKGSFLHRVASMPIGTHKSDELQITGEDLVIEAKRLVAAELCQFQAATERMKPYVKWLRNLTNEDTIISFNYDCVLERLADEHRIPLNVWGVEGTTVPEGPCLLKLHGSVDWRRVEGRTPVPFERSGDYAYATDHPEDDVLCTPGESKLDTCEGDLSPLWRYASERIKNASAARFIGYRIPESDAAAREMLLDAMYRPPHGTGAPKHTVGLAVEIVLGAQPHHDRSRLSSLLEMIGCKVTDRGLFAQDFLQAWHPNPNRQAEVLPPA